MNKEFIKTLQSAIRDNKSRGTVGEFLMEKILPDSKLLAVSAYFTIYAYEALKDHLNQLSYDYDIADVKQKLTGFMLKI